MSERPRYIVTEVSGMRIVPGASPSRNSGQPRKPLPISVSVLDTAYCHREVKRFEPHGMRGHAETRAAALAFAHDLNRRDAEAPDDPSPVPRIRTGWDAAA